MNKSNSRRKPTVNPKAFIAIAARGNRPRYDREARVYLPTSMVRPDTDRQLMVWQWALSCSRGQLLDHLTNWAAWQGFLSDHPSLKTKNKK
jgi:hypothetical protein